MPDRARKVLERRELDFITQLRISVGYMGVHSGASGCFTDSHVPISYVLTERYGPRGTTMLGVYEALILCWARCAALNRPMLCASGLVPC